MRRYKALSKSGQKPKKFLYIYRSLLVCGFLILMGGSFMVYWQYIDNQQNSARATTLIQQANSGINHIAPSTLKVTNSEFDNYTSAPSLPRYIFIPKIGVRAIVRELGLTADNQIAAPDNVFDTGWFIGSSKPGQSGAVLIDGHVSSWTTHGVFYSIKSLVAGDAIRVELGGGNTINYKVVKTVVYDYQDVDISKLLAPVITGQPGLNLITCTGDVISGTNDFNERVVVYSTQIP
jgi:sortase (surface protein transpeptidase)